MVTIFWTGGGQTSPAGLEGRRETGNPSQLLTAVTVTIDGQPATVLSTGAVPFAWGMLMTQVQVPDGAGTSNPVPVIITAGAASSPDAASTMWVRQ